MMLDVRAGSRRRDAEHLGVALHRACRDPIDAVLTELQTTVNGLTTDQASRRRSTCGLNAIDRGDVRVWTVLIRQLRNPLLVLLVATAVLALFFGEHSDALIILTIITLSIALGFVNDYRSERVLAQLRERVRHHTTVWRDGKPIVIDTRELVPGDVVDVRLGDVIPADVRWLATHDLSCDEATITGEAAPAEKRVDDREPQANGGYLGTIVKSGNGRGIVVATGAQTAFGAIAARLAHQPPLTGFELGLRDFSQLLIRVTVVLAFGIFIINALLQRSFVESLLFALAIAVGLTPQLLPAIVTVSLSLGARRLAERRVLVKRLVSIEDLGNVEVLLTDKTGTLTLGGIEFRNALDRSGAPSADVLALGAACCGADAQTASDLDTVLLRADPAATTAAAARWTRIAELPFDHDRRRMSVLLRDRNGDHLVVAKGAPESILACCEGLDPAAQRLIDEEFSRGGRVLAVATKTVAESRTLTRADEAGLTFAGVLVFVDPPKADAAGSIARLTDLGVAVKVVTGDNAAVAAFVCRELGLAVTGTLTGVEIAALEDRDLQRRLADTTIFARVSPEEKGRIVRLLRAADRDVAFLGDGVNDAVALHEADVGISVDSAVDIAKDAADIVLLEKDLGAIADGIVEGRRIFANTIKYVFMATSSNFGNMFSAAGASLFLTFLPMLPSQILLNNLLYDFGELAIPTDSVDPELLRRPARWDMRAVQRFMLLFGPLSSIFDGIMFALLLRVFHTGPPLFRSAWFVESLLTQSFVIFVIRTRRLPFLRSRPGVGLVITTIVCAGVGVALPFTPAAAALGFTPLPATLVAVIAAMLVAYLCLAEGGKAVFYHQTPSSERSSV